MTISLTALKWSLALVASMLIHAGGATFWQPEKTDTEMKGDSSPPVAIFGGAFVDTISAKDTAITKKPIQPITNEGSSILQPIPETIKAPVPEIAPNSSIKPISTQLLKKTNRKENQQKQKKSGIKHHKKKRLTIAKTKNNNGKSTTTRKKGVAHGIKTAKNSQSGKKQRSTHRAGSAFTSNYPGKIVRKLRRSIRYPDAAKRKRIRGRVLVSFIVSKAGNVSQVRILHGSGSSILDEAALKTVYRAAPFPKIPDQAGKSKWAFSVPLAFN